MSGPVLGTVRETIIFHHKTNTKDFLVSPSTPKAFNPRSTAYAASSQSRSKPTHSGTTPTLSTRDSPDTHASRDQNDNFEDDDEDTILLGRVFTIFDQKKITYGGYSIIKQKTFERGKSRALICMNFQL